MHGYFDANGAAEFERAQGLPQRFLFWLGVKVDEAVNQPGSVYKYIDLSDLAERPA